MGQASCSDLVKANHPPDPPKSAVASTPACSRKSGSCERSPQTPSVARCIVAEGSLQNGQTDPTGFTEADIARLSETPEIERLRAELAAKERALEAMQEDAGKHLKLIEALENEAFQKEQAIVKLRASESVQKEVATLLEQLRQRDGDVEKLRHRAATEEATLKALTVEAQTKGDVVEDLVTAIAEQTVGQTPPRPSKNHEVSGMLKSEVPEELLLAESQPVEACNVLCKQQSLTEFKKAAEAQIQAQEEERKKRSRNEEIRNQRGDKSETPSETFGRLHSEQVRVASRSLSRSRDPRCAD